MWGNKVSGHKRILHSDVAHSDAVTYGDRRENNGHTACHRNSELNGFCDLIEVHMTGNDLIVGADDTDHRAPSLLFRISERVEETPVGGL